MARDLLSEGESDSEGGGVTVPKDVLKVNDEFAKRFEHNKKREELQRLEEKIGRSSIKRKRSNKDGHSASSTDDESSSSSEDEDEEGEFATAALDSEIMATLNAIRSKDPRVYDQSTTFYTEPTEIHVSDKDKQSKPLYLRDYHRQNLLNGTKLEDDEQEQLGQPLSYNQQQNQLKKNVVKEMHEAAESDEDDESGSEAGFLVKKVIKPSLAKSEPSAKLDIENADRDPETFLSNFMAARAWVPTEQSQLQPFESDDEEEERRAEEYEEAYNMRFEDPAKSNEKLRSHARDMAAKYSVRREEENPRKRRRELEKQKKEEQRQQLREDKARLKKLRMDEVQEKVVRIKRAAGLRTDDLLPQDWAHFIDDEWDDTKWEQEMQKRFDEKYYAEEDIASEIDEEISDGESKTRTKRKPKKPQFEDDIDIQDIVPDFQVDEAANFSLTDDEGNTNAISNKRVKQTKQERQKDARKERRIIEQLVDDQLKLDLEHSLPGTTASSGFRYRETSPNSFNLTARDILMAEDSQLNQYVGLKKLASFRDTDKKQKDKKRLGKKARLRQWRLDTFGNEDGLQEAELVPSKQPAITADNDEEGVGIVDIRENGGKKKRRKRKGTKRAEQAEAAL